MGTINRIGNSLNAKIGQGIKWVTKRPIPSRLLEAGIKDPASFAAMMMVTSFISKDFVNCIIYTYQSWNNKKIPEDKRGFNAFLDLFNGILNVTGQVASYALFDKLVIPKFFGKRYSGTFKDADTKQTSDLADRYGNASKRKSRFLADNIDGLVDDTINGVINGKKADKAIPNKRLVNRIQNLVETKKTDLINLSKLNDGSLDALKDVIKKQLKEEFKAGGGKFGNIEKGFTIVIGALATTALVKRTLVPLISTPLAGSASDYFDKKKRIKDRLSYEREAAAKGQFNKLSTDAFSKVSTRNNW